MWQCMSMPHIPLVVKVWLDSLNREVMGDNEEWWIYDSGKQHDLSPRFLPIMDGKMG